MTLAPSASCEYSAAQNRYLRALTTRCRSSTVAPRAALFFRSALSIAAFLRVLCVVFEVVAFGECEAKHARWSWPREYQYRALPGVRGNGMVSRTLARPVT